MSYRSSKRRRINQYALSRFPFLRDESTVGGGGSRRSAANPNLPLSAFQWEITPGTLEVCFTSQSSSPATAEGTADLVHEWMFNDGMASVSTEQDPCHTFPAANGNYPVTLVVTNSLGFKASITKYIYLPEPNPLIMVADFDFAPGTGPFDIVFTDTSNGSPVGWTWSYREVGSGNAPLDFSNQQNPAYTFPSQTLYEVTLVVTDASGNQSQVTKIVQVNIPVLPMVPDFAYVNGTGLAVNLTDLSTGGPIVSWNWDFGDLTSSSAQNPAKTYTVAGTWPVTLTIEDSLGNTETVTKDVTVPAPGILVTADFSFVADQILLAAAFTDLSTSTGGPIVAWTWDFGDGTSSADQNPAKNWTVAGTFSVTLTAEDSLGNTGTVTRAVTVPEPSVLVTADFSSVADPTLLLANLTDLSTSTGGPIVAWTWDFGDGSSSADQNPAKTWLVPGTFPVTLTVEDSLGNTGTVTKDVTVPEPTGLVPDFTYLLNGLTVTDILDTTTGGPTSWLWLLDGVPLGSDQNQADFLLPAPGIYELRLSVADAGGNAAFVIKTIDATAALVSSFTYKKNGGTLYDFAVNITNGGPVTAYGWFLDGIPFSTVENPAPRTGVSAGVHLLRLSVISDASGNFSSTEQTVVVTDNFLTADFSHVSDPTLLLVDFTDTTVAAANGGSVFQPTVWNWDFGDGNTSSLQNPSHTYATAGGYAVTLTAEDVNGNCSVVTNSVASPAGNPLFPFVANFVYSVSGTTATVEEAILIGTAVSWEWTLDGSLESNQKNPPPILFLAPGDHTVTLTAVNSQGTSSSQTQIITIAAPFEANFIYSVSGDTATVQEAITVGTAVSWTWTLDGGLLSNQKNPPPILFLEDGNHTVTLTAVNSLGTSSSQTQIITIGGGGPVDAKFTYTLTPGFARSFDFTDTSNSAAGTIVSWLWEFGFEPDSSLQNPTNFFSVGSVYTVSLTATDSAGNTGTVVKTIVLGDTILASFSSDNSPGSTNPGLVAFTDTSTGSVVPVEWDWRFGDLANILADSALRDPTYTYTQAGTFPVTLTVTSANGLTSTITTAVTPIF